MNDEALCEWLRTNSNGTFHPSAEAADRIESQNRELAELKASIPQIQHDAIMGLVDYVKRKDILFLSVTEYAKNILTQAKEQSE